MEGDTYSEEVKECEISTSEKEDVEVVPSNVRERLDLFFSDPLKHDRVYGGFEASLLNTLTVLMILASQIILLIETAPPYYKDSEEGHNPWFTLEVVIVSWFTVEVILRFYASCNRLLFCKDILNIADMLAVFPFYVELALSTQFSFNFKIFRLLRAVRMVKISRFHNGLKTVGRALYETAEQLVMGFLLIVICMFLCSSFVFYLERSSISFSKTHNLWVINVETLQKAESGTYYLSDKEEASPFQSIPHTFWWCITTLTTVGYGDAVPSSPFGKVAASLTMILGVFVLSLPTSIIGSKFLDLYKEAQRLEEEETRINERQKKDVEVVELLVFIDELVARGRLSASQAFSDENGEIITRPGDAEMIRLAAFQECYFDDIRDVFLAAKRAPTEEQTIERFTKGMMELNLQRRNMNIAVGDLKALCELDDDDILHQEEKIRMELKMYDEEESKWRAEPVKVAKISSSLIAEKCLDPVKLKSMTADEQVRAILSVSHVALDGCGIDEIDNLECVSNVTHLYLQNNMIQEIKELDWLPNLTMLILSHNTITEVQGLSTLDSLRVLDLSYNKIKEIDAKAFPRGLTILDLKGNEAKEEQYREELICYLPQLDTIDGGKVSRMERAGESDEEGDEYEYAEDILKNMADKRDTVLKVSMMGGDSFESEIQKMRSVMVRDYEKRCTERMALIDRMIEESDVHDDSDRTFSSKGKSDTKQEAASSLMDVASHQKNLGTTTLNDTVDGFRVDIRSKKQTMLERSRTRQADTEPSESFTRAKKEIQSEQKKKPVQGKPPA